MPTATPNDPHAFPNCFRHKESGYIQRRRTKLKLPDTNTLPEIGLALSGGGIRSACFSLGVIKSLTRGTAFKHIDFISTAEGGGYTGSIISWYYKQTQSAEEPITEEEPIAEEGPLAEKASAVPNGPAKHIDDWEEKLRCGARSLTPSQSNQNINRFITITKVMASNLLVWGLVASGLLLLLISLPNQPMRLLNGLLFLAILLSGALASYITYYSLANQFKVAGPKHLSRLKAYFRIYSRRAVSLLIFCTSLGTLPYIHQVLFIAPEQFAIAILFVGAYGLANSTLNEQTTAHWKLLCYSTLTLYGLLLSTYSLAHYIYSQVPNISLIIALAFLVTACALAWLCHTRNVSMARHYQDRLMALFTPDLNSSNGKRVSSNRNPPPDRTLLKEFPGLGGPYPLINCNLVLVDSRDKTLHTRGGANFIYSPYACGSSATGWADTDTYMQGSITYASAMATSGGPEDSNAGCANLSTSRSRLISFTLRLLNIRLATWSSNPATPHYQPKLINHYTSSLTKALRLGKGLGKSLEKSIGKGIGIGKGFSEQARIIELTSGGRFSNLAMYELARRKLAVIIICDASPDPTYKFSSFRANCDRIRKDFNYVIHMHSNDQYGPHNYSGFSDLIPRKEPRAVHQHKFAQKGHAFGVINYEPHKPKEKALHGLVIYLKPTLTRELSSDLQHYKDHHPCFPQANPVRRPFNDKQVTAHSALGAEITQLMLNNIAEIKPIIDQYPNMMINERQLNFIFGNDNYSRDNEVA